VAKSQTVYRRKKIADRTSLEHIGDMTLEFGSISINIGLEVMMTEWCDQMRGKISFPNPGRQVME